jgi:hypothetical protein
VRIKFAVGSHVDTALERLGSDVVDSAEGCSDSYEDVGASVVRTVGSAVADSSMVLKVKKK